MASQKRRYRKTRILVFLIFSSLASLWYYVTQPIFISKVDHRVLVSPKLLEKHVYELSVTLAPRDFLHPGNLRKVANYIKSEFEKTNAKVRLQDHPYTAEIINYVNKNSDGLNAQKLFTESAFPNKYYQNVIAEFGPDTKQRIVIGAHYDAVGETPGADDNATGIAGLIEIAKLLSKEKLKIKVELVAYCLEEPPFFRTKKMGSYVHAFKLKKQGKKIKVMIALEMLGYYDEKANTQSYPVGFLKYFYSDKGNFITVIGKFGQAGITRKIKSLISANTSIPVYSMNAPASLVGVDFSDHLNYWKNNYQAVMITDTAFYRNKHYHKGTDTFDKLDYQRMSSVVAAIFLAIRALASP